jgi:ABC-type antimicrobial peptide transport system permease subunit
VTFRLPTSEGEEKFDDIYTNTVGADYFRTLGTKIVAGREFGQNDRDAVILNQSAVRNFFSGHSAVGDFIFQAVPAHGPPQGHEIVGIVQDSKYENIRNNAPATIYFAYALSDPSTLPPASQLVVRTERPGIVEQKLHQVLKEAAPDAPLNPLIPFQQEILEMTARERILVDLSVLYSLLSLLMTAAGIYGTLSHHARRRTSEVGLRFALGASREKIVKLFVRQVFVKLLPGVIVGLILGFALARSISSLLFGVHASSLWIYSSCLLLVLATIALAIYGPIRRVSLMHPMQALRRD